jgi:CheY-like chemotaxis protein
MAFRKKEFEILVVDDEPLILNVMINMLGSMGYGVTTAQGSQEAIALLTGSAYWLVITDYNMPTLNGYQLTTWIKQHHPRTRVVIMTGSSNIEIDELIANGNIVDAWLFKPFGFKELRKVMSDLELLYTFHSGSIPDAIPLKPDTGRSHWHVAWGDGYNPKPPRRKSNEN